MKLNKLLSFLFLGVLTLGVGLNASSNNNDREIIDTPVLKAVENTTTVSTKDIYISAEGIGLPGKYTPADYKISGLDFHFENVRKYYGSRISMKRNYGLVYNTIASPSKIKSISMVFKEEYYKDGTPHDYSITEVYASNAANNVEAANKITPVIDGWLSTYTFPTDKACNYVTIKAGDVTTNIDMIVVRMEDAVMQEADNLATTLNKKLDEYCGIKSVSPAVWNEIGALINNATPEAKQVFKDAVLNELFFEGKDPLQATEIQHFVQRHDYIVAKYGFDNLLNRNVKASMTGVINFDINIDTILIVSFGLIASVLLTSFIILKNKKKFN